MAATVKKVDDAPEGDGNVPATPLDTTVVDPDEYKKAELQEQAEELDLSTSGTKQDIADRINENEKLGDHKPEVLGPYEAE